MRMTTLIDIRDVSYEMGGKAILREVSWSVNASSLEEFVTKQLVLADKVDDFKSVYKDPTAFLCLFIVDKSGATFVFIPRY